MTARTLWSRFEAVVTAAPDRLALILPQNELSFAQLHHLALKAAAALDAAGLRAGDVVAIQWPKRLGTFALWLACLRQGLPYVFLDPRNPEARTVSILTRVQPRLVVSAARLDNPFGERLESEPDTWLAGLPDHPAPPAARTHGLSPAYIMFTSGSTGEPKGAVIPQQGVLSLMDWVKKEYGAPGEARFSGLNPLHFDNAVFDLYGGLLNGSPLVPVETGDAANPLQWVKRLRAGRANVIFAVPTLFQTLQQLRLLNPASLPDATAFQFGGEGFPIAALRAFHDAFAGQARLVNVYGPTETSCICSSLVINPAMLDAAGDGFVSLGRMHDGFEHVILDEEGKPVAPGLQGELWIGGANVGLGYIANPDETARRFRQDPRQSRYHAIFYRTGDAVREDRDGLLWFAGRVDHQVKVRGHRIELEEIDLALEAFSGITRGVAIARQGADGTELCAAFCAESVINEAELRVHCRALLPAYMQPVLLRQLDALPQNANGKVDRKAIVALFAEGT